MAWLPEWQLLPKIFSATETHLASCSYGSIHQKEFRILGVHVDLAPLYAPCAKDHGHVKVQGKYTKGAAVYTDKLASRFADVIEEAIRRRRSAENMKEEKSWRWKRSPHINVLESSAYARLLYHLAARFPKSRFPVGLGSSVALSAIVKGRSASCSLRPALRRIGAITLAGCLYPSCHFFLTRLNTSDHPTRDKPIPPPLASFLDFDSELHQLLSLHNMSGLRRFAANWVRLVLLLIGAGRPWVSTHDSWRYASWTYASYPYHRCSAPREAQLAFDRTLGFPGEGPFQYLSPSPLVKESLLYLCGFCSRFCIPVLLGFC